MPDSPEPAKTSPTNRPHSRRGFLLGSIGTLVAAAGGGAVAALVHSEPKTSSDVALPPPPLLSKALATENALIAAIDAAGHASQLAHLRADHVAHRDAIAGAIAVVVGSAASGSPVSSAPPRTPVVSLSQLKAMEQAAANSAASAALNLTGEQAALLASISACEASHVELLA